MPGNQSRGIGCIAIRLVDAQAINNVPEPQDVSIVAVILTDIAWNAARMFPCLFLSMQRIDFGWMGRINADGQKR
jgi:hypothetical protein